MESGYFLPQCEALCVGADAFFLDGTLINKMGSCILGLAAKEMNIPFYVISETDKMIYSAYSREKIELEEKSKHEVYPNQAQFKIRNIYFDITAPEYIAGFITEKGVYRADQLGDLVS